MNESYDDEPFNLNLYMSSSQKSTSYSDINQKSSITITPKFEIQLNNIHELLKTIRTETKQQFEQLQSENRDLKEKVEALTSKICKKKAEDNFKTEVLYQNKNLLDEHASSISKYVTKIMEILFTNEELRFGYIKAKGSNSTRIDLNEEKVQILKGK